MTLWIKETLKLKDGLFDHKSLIVQTVICLHCPGMCTYMLAIIPISLNRCMLPEQAKVPLFESVNCILKMPRLRECYCFQQDVISTNLFWHELLRPPSWADENKLHSSMMKLQLETQPVATALVIKITHVLALNLPARDSVDFWIFEWNFDGNETAPASGIDLLSKPTVKLNLNITHSYVAIPNHLKRMMLCLEQQWTSLRVSKRYFELKFQLCFVASSACHLFSSTGGVSSSNDLPSTLLGQSVIE